MNISNRLDAFDVNTEQRNRPHVGRYGEQLYCFERLHQSGCRC
jgi:hypothetical protein